MNFNLQWFNMLNFIATIILICYSTAMHLLIAACLHFALCLSIIHWLFWHTHCILLAKEFVQMSATLIIIDFTEMMQSYMHKMQLL